jgi:transcription-repair coupling factor (superfamily II helicase)
MIEQSIRKHSAFTELESILNNPENKQKYLPITEIYGVTPQIYESLCKLISKNHERGLITVFRDNQELRRYIESAILVIFSKANATQLIKSILEYGFIRSHKVENLGEYSLKGDVLNFWPPGFNHPIRVSFFDDEIEYAEMYDEIYGRKVTSCKFFLLGDLTKIDSKIQLDQFNVIHPERDPLNAILVYGGDRFENQESNTSVSFDFTYPQLYFNRLDILEKDLALKSENGYEIKIVTKQKKSIPTKLEKYIQDDKTIDSGFESKSIKTIVLTDKELFGTVFLGSEVKKLSSERARKILANLEGDIEIGDFIVHEDHGVGVYKGIKQEEYVQEIKLGVGERIKKIIKEDYILIGYAQEDELYVPLSQIDKLTKYISIDDQDPEITRLGKTDWEAIRKKTKESIFAMAKELVALYAQREIANSKPIDHENSQMYEEFISDFPYKITKDQTQTELDVLNDLSLEKPMNRIIVGDVGFGKTEIAMRGAFKMVEGGYQVAVLCPTTVLTTQHEKVFKERFSKFGIRVESLSRLNSTAVKSNLVDLENGKIDIIVGTHRLLSNDIRFKNLGMIIVDEEQKFGVKQKEKLKQIEIGVHVLSMSATPIPRSLSMALSSIQDISIIQTPPEGRKSIENVVTKLDQDRVKTAIAQELKRNGQVYYVHNKVETIQSKASQISKLLPKAKVIFAHGQMNPNTLMKNVSEFYEGKFDILVCTTIIENGLDMPNVNTIIVEHAQNFGLGQLYQLRGRVGRGDKQGYAYFFYDGDVLTDDDSELEANIKNPTYLKRFRERRKYRQRLKAIKESSELGAGFKLASRDLEIRGAGNLLGKQQHGNIKQIGYALYMQMLAEEIEKLKVSNETHD